MPVVEITVPDIGGFTDVPIIEVLVAPGDAIAKDAPLVTLESDKATMEVPATAAGTVTAVKVKVGDKVSEGTALVSVETGAAAAEPVTTEPKPADSVAAAADSAGGTTATPGAAAAAATAIVTELTVPDIGGFTAVPVIGVFVKAGDVVAKDAPLVELESDKATMEVPASAAGRIRDVKVRVGDKVSQGDVLALVEAAGAAPPAVTPPSAGPPPAAASSIAPALANPPAPLLPTTAPAPVAATNGSAARPNAPSVHASPAIRRFARELGVDLSRVGGSGPNGRVTRDDVQAFVKRTLSEAPRVAPEAPPAFAGLPPWPLVDFAKFGPIERIPLSRIKRISGPSLARNWVTIPHVTQHDDADVTDLEAFRVQINGEQKDVKLTMLAFLIKAAVATLKAFPDVNGSLDGADIVHKHYWNIGFAADTPNGLVVPVIKDADRKGVFDIARETGELAKKAREGKLGPADMSGGTFSISSLGGIGGTYFTPIINAPEVAILGVCRATVRPVWDGKAFEPRTILPLSFSYDHRVIDGAAAARFTAHLAHVLADLRRTLL